LQVGGFSSQSYNRFGTSTTGHANYISASNDLLVSGDLEVDGSISAQFASISQIFIANNTASASAFFRGNGSGAVNQSNFSIGLGNGTERLNIFNNDNSPIVTIASTGYMGIGTTSPQTLLSIAKNNVIGLATTNGADDGYIVLSAAGADSSARGARISMSGTNRSGAGGLLELHAGTTGTTDTNSIRLFVGDTEMVRIASTGNVGIGTTGPYSKLSIVGGDTDPSLTVDTAALLNIDNGLTDLAFTIDTTTPFAASIQHRHTSSSGNSYPIALNPLGGNVSIGTTSFNSGSILTIKGTFGAHLDLLPSADVEAGTYIIFRNAANSIIGSVTQNSGAAAVTYNTTSDRRLKENIIDSGLGLNELIEISVREFNFISDPNKAKTQGLIAQELYEIYPYAVTVGGDDPKMNPWSVDYGRLTPLIVKAIQELNDKITVLEAANGQLVPDEMVINGNTVNGSLIFNAVISMFKDAFNIVFEKGLLRVAHVVAENVTATVGTFQKVKTNELCVDDICVTREKFRQVFGEAVTGTSTTGENEPVNTPAPLESPTPSPEPELTPSPSELPTPEPEPELTASEDVAPTSSDAAEPTPEATPEPTPTLEASPESTPETSAEILAE